MKDYVTLYGTSANMYCEKIKLPGTKDIRINANYRLYEGVPNGSNIVARVYSFDGIFLTGSLECDLPEPDGSLQYRSCAIEPQAFSFDEKEYMICVTSSSGDPEKEYYSLARENIGNSTGYVCSESGCQKCGEFESLGNVWRCNKICYPELLKQMCI